MTIKVSKSSEPKKVAGAIASNLRTKGSIEIIAVGPIAVNQTVKSIILARSYLAANDMDINMTMSFHEVEIAESKRTSIKFSLRSKAKTDDDDADNVEGQEK